MTNDMRQHYERMHRVGLVGFWIGMGISLLGVGMYLWKLL